jgi:biopolymer transport protein ExbD
MRFKRRMTPITRVDLIPMIDIVFQLVVFFMVSSTFIITPGIGIEFPESRTAEPVAMSRLVVTLVSSDEVYLNKERHTLESLDQALGDLSEEEREQAKTLILEADTEVPYGLIVETLDLLRENGFKGVNLKMREEE